MHSFKIRLKILCLPILLHVLFLLLGIDTISQYRHDFFLQLFQVLTQISLSQ